MKNTLKVLALTLVAVIVCSVICSCGASNPLAGKTFVYDTYTVTYSDDIDPEVKALYESLLSLSSGEDGLFDAEDYEDQITCNADNTYTVTGSENETGTYTIDGSKVTFVSDSGEETTEMKYEGGKLFASFEEEGIIITIYYKAK
ncbi:MAG: hypothetical protein J5938_02410 [Clostridia bacterium]|nr:hypothetical protein [Clostridia bacterium]